MSFLFKQPPPNVTVEDTDAARRALNQFYTRIEAMAKLYPVHIGFAGDVHYDPRQYGLTGDSMS